MISRRERSRKDGQNFIPSGIVALDHMLRGGIPSYATVILAGSPGTGKTTLAQQILFANAARQQQCVYLVTFSESPMKTARYQSRFQFFDPAEFGKNVIFMDIGQTIRKEGLTSALEIISDTLREIQPQVVVIDSFKAIHDMATSSQEMRTFIYDLVVELSAMQVTTLLVGEYSEDDIAHMPEFAIADGIIWLYSETRSDKQIRFLRVLKMRGVDHMSGAYPFAIRSNGLELFVVNTEGEATSSTFGEPIKTGLTELDVLCRGGFPSRSATLLTGSAGTGKSTLALQYVCQGLQGDDASSVYFSYEETPAHLLANAERFGWKPGKLQEQGRLRIEYTPLSQINAEEQVLHIQRVVAETGAQRIVVDSLTMLLAQIEHPQLIRTLLYTLITTLSNAGCTSIFISDPPIGGNMLSRFGVEESLIDGVIVLRIRPANEERVRQRTLEIYKMRGVAHASGEHAMKITTRGVQIFPRAEEAVW
jgi:circadian clock protein KaiC